MMTDEELLTVLEDVVRALRVHHGGMTVATKILLDARRNVEGVPAEAEVSATRLRAAGRTWVPIEDYQLLLEVVRRVVDSRGEADAAGDHYAELDTTTTDMAIAALRKQHPDPR